MDRKPWLRPGGSVQKGRYFMKLGVLGVWYGDNYGSVLTYWALERTLRSLGHEVCMIQKPWTSQPDPERDGNEALSFARKHFPWISPLRKLSDFSSFNSQLDGYVIGSDQVWNYGISKDFGHSFYLDFADDSKRKISYSASFGHPIDFAPPEERVVLSALLKRFDAISVREASGVTLAKEVYDVDAVRVLDPVFLPTLEEYGTLLEEAKWEPPSQYILSYILDPTPEKVSLIQRISHELKLPLINILDGRGDRAANEAALTMPALRNVNALTFLKAFASSSYVITDSFHGTSFSILFSKPFLAIPNVMRGITRFDSILSLTGLNARSCRDLLIDTDITPFLQPIDYSRVHLILDREREQSLRWLEKSLKKPRSSLPTIPFAYTANRLTQMPEFARELAQKHPTDKGWQPAKGVHTPYVPATLNLNPMCNGCLSCVNACPFDALGVTRDEFGYYVPELIPQNCTDCGLCVRVCPAIDLPVKRNDIEPSCYSFQSTDQHLLQTSTSGGAFMVLATEMLRQGGAVAGAAWDGVNLRHILVDRFEDLPQLQKSKYLQPSVGMLYREIKSRLHAQQPVLFSGLPCQVAGLQSFLKKPYKLLTTVDLLCGNTPSSAFFTSYIEETFGAVQSYEFRYKGPEATGPHTVKVTHLDGHKEVRSQQEDLYQQAYHPHTMCPLHCENCRYQAVPRYGDITIGDFWGLPIRDPKVDGRPGVSVILVNNTQGKQYLEDAFSGQTKLLIERPVEWLGKNGFVLPSALPWTGPQRNTFYDEWVQTASFTDAMKAVKNRIAILESYPIMCSYNSQVSGFEFDPRFWNQSITDRGIKIAPKKGYAKLGIHASMPLTIPVREGRKYRLSLEFDAVTDSPVINFHVKNSNTGRFQVIHGHKVTPGTTHGATTSITFTADANGYNQFMIGAVHIQGPEAYFLLKSMVIEALPNP